jgi:hypothetical protein
MRLKFKQATQISITCLVVGLVFAMFASSASADCGSPFTNKAQAVNYYKTHSGAAHALKKWLRNHKVYEFNADQGLIQYLEQSNVRVFNAPQGYKLTKNTYCRNGPEGGYSKYTGLYDNMSGKPMLWYCNKAGKCYPILKGYCRNAVMGPPVVKHPPCKCRKPKKHKHKHKKSCTAQGKVVVNGNCVKQTNTAANDCQATVGGQWVGNQCVNIQVNANCSNVSVGNEGNVNQGGNCNNGGTENCVGQNNCNVEQPPCSSCPPPCEKCETKSPPEIAIEAINDFETKEKSTICARTTASAGDSLNVTFFAENGGEFANHGVATLRSGTTNEWCSQYTAPSEVPPGGCDIIKAVVHDNTTGLSGKDEKKAPIKPETF